MCSVPMAYACENEQLEINCGNDLITILNSNFGRLSSDLCPQNIGDVNLECVFDASAIVRER